MWRVLNLYMIYVFQTKPSCHLREAYNSMFA
ncbi:hypothetical protein C7379_12420 [Hallella colorans]|uniref:Uncharacterized protein n=1 Tax=Hallella colorans TaxID=1703337 RepID=A0A2U0TYV7_9BACT|nr:hypothetical protein C7379_12420 [Hallella colorans]